MKYFTRGWSSGEHDDDEAERMREAYSRRVAALRPEMSQSLAELVTAVSLHDALVDRVLWDRAARRLQLELICEHQPKGWVGLRLVYCDAQVSDRTLDILAERARDRRTQVLYDEVDLEKDGLWVHRILFWPEGEISVYFTSLELTRAARVDGKWDCAGCDPFVLAERLGPRDP